MDSELQTYTEVDVSDMVDETETYVDTDIENQTREDLDSEINTIPDSETFNSEEQVVPETKVQNQGNKVEIVRATRLPLARIKNIMKMDPDVSIVNAEAVFLVTKATEMFLETIAKETYTYTSQNKRKVISKKDLDVVINKADCLCFLEGAMDF